MLFLRHSVVASAKQNMALLPRENRFLFATGSPTLTFEYRRYGEPIVA